MEYLKLAIKTGLPLIHLRTDDILNVEKILSYIAGEPVKPLQVPETIVKTADLKVPEGRVFFTSAECKSLVKLYNWCEDEGKTIIFVNTDKSVLHYDGNTLVTPKELIIELLSDVVEDPESLVPSFAGLTLKDVGEMAQLTMTRDETLTVRGITETRRSYNNLKGIQQVDTNLDYYVCPVYLDKWMKENSKFFTEAKHPSLIPRGLLFDGPPGTGKTLASKYIANKLGVPLYRLDLGAMMGKYVGDSESALNSALAQIDSVSPSTIILDEVEKVFQSQGDSGVTSRLLSQLLWWLQEHKSRSFVVMTTNDITRIPEELYREGRIDGTMEFLGIDSVEAGMEFGKNAFIQLANEVGINTQPESFSSLNKRIKRLFTDSDHVPQAKIVQEVRGLVREISVEEA